jgi:hypothetical protein
MTSSGIELVILRLIIPIASIFFSFFFVSVTRCQCITTEFFGSLKLQICFPLDDFKDFISSQNTFFYKFASCLL